MYQSHVYLEVRILFSSSKNVFKNSIPFSVDSNVLKKVHTLASALNCKWNEQPFLEKQISNQNLPSDLNLTGFSPSF